jgi:TolB-like protein/Tfp pilus assembly protein PilF
MLQHFPTVQTSKNPISATMNDLRPTLPASGRFRFGTFEVDLHERELYNRGIRIALQQKPFRILELLIRKRGELVTREELAQYLWPNLHVSFDRGLNTAVNVLRRALGDSPRNSRYIETRSGLGYRFIAPVEEISERDTTSADSTTDSVAILPFEKRTTNPTLALVADGITESIIARLSEIQHVRVIARATAFRFSEHADGPQSVGEKLNVRTVLTGRVGESGDSLMISAELIEVKSGRRLWGADYKAVPTGIFAVETKICTAVSKMLVLPPGSNPQTFSKTHTGSFEAYQDYLKGRYFYSRMTEEDLRKSIAHFEAALGQDPRYALAHTGLADVYSLFAMLGLMPAATAHARSRELAMAALKIDEELAEAHASLAGVKKLFEWDWIGSEAEYLRALELNANSADAHRWYAALLCAMNRIDEGMNEIRRAQELDPLSIVINMELAWDLYMARDFQGAMEQSWRTLVLDSKYAPAQHTLALSYEQLGMYEEAITELQNARMCSGDHPVAIASLAHAHAAAGNRDEAFRILDELDKISQRRHVSPYWMGVVQAGLSAFDLAFQSLETAFEQRDVWLVWLYVEPRFDALRSDSRFDRLVRRLGFNSYPI